MSEHAGANGESIFSQRRQVSLDNGSLLLLNEQDLAEQVFCFIVHGRSPWVRWSFYRERNRPLVCGIYFYPCFGLRLSPGVYQLNGKNGHRALEQHNLVAKEGVLHDGV
jgi:hypothetical protein